MTVNKLAVAGLAVATLMLASFGALGQEAGAAPAEAAAPAEESSAAPQDNWLKVCDPLEDGKKACIMRQVVVANEQFLGSFMLRDDPGAESRLQAVAAVPLGVLLPFGLSWQIDNNKPLRIPYFICDPVSCATQIVVNEAFVSSLKKGAVLKLIAKARSRDEQTPVRDLVVEINLAGFTAVYDSETAMTFDEYNQTSSGASALEQQLQDRAEELRRQLSGDAATPAPTPAPQ